MAFYEVYNPKRLSLQTKATEHKAKENNIFA